MASWLIVVVMLLYLGIACSLALDGKAGLALVHLFYALANAGMLIAIRG